MLKKTLTGILAIGLLLSGSVMAWHIDGHVYCDVDQDGSISTGDTPLSGVGVNVQNSSGLLFTGSTGSEGHYFIDLLDMPDTYTATLNASTLPADAVIVQPPGGQYDFALTEGAVEVTRDWLIDSAICRPQGKCWMTGGGVKFSSIAGMTMAEKGPSDSMGGNVFPSCDPDPGDGGQWNHVSHSTKLHFLGRSIDTVSCGNVPGIDPGSESPVTPFNYIEYQGTGTLKGIRGNKVDHGTVYFFARVEDRNEPGSNGAKDGVDIDRYFIHVFADPGNPTGTTLMLLDVDSDPSTVDPVTITGGNLQLHISSCDDPPNF